ncbi:hypothetical protein LOS25_16710 [Enterococcus faecium]|nr:hypothetical protein [Enterococcus faecium]
MEFRSAYLSGDHNFDKREKEIKRLDTGEIHYIFTVDIFNEGIDIPKSKSSNYAAKYAI